MGKPWLKLWTETLHDRKLRRIPPEQRWCFIGLLCIAADGPDDGRLMVGDEPMTDADFTDALAVPLETWTAARDYFLRSGILHQDGDLLILTNYRKRQAPKDPTAAERMRRWRQRNVDTVSERNVTRDVTDELRVESESDVKDDDDTKPPPRTETDPEYKVLTDRAQEKWGYVLTGDVLLEIGEYLDVARSAGHPEWCTEAVDLTACAKFPGLSYFQKVMNTKLGNGNGNRRNQHGNGQSRGRAKGTVSSSYAEQLAGFKAGG